MGKMDIGIVVLLLVALLGSTRSALRFIEDYKNVHTRWYMKLIRRVATFNEAYYACQLEGRQLASPGKHGTSGAFESIVSRYPNGLWTDFSAPPYGAYYSHYLDAGPRFLGSYVTYFNQTVPSSSRRCLVSLPSRKMRDSNCTEDFPFICSRWGEYWRFGNTGCNSYDKEYHWYASGCYKLHKNGLQWPAAMIKCRAEGGGLAVADSSSEADIFTALLGSAVNDTIKSRYGKDVAYVGIYYYHTHKVGQWVTLYGKRISDTGFSKMFGYKGEPKESCGGWRTSGNYVPLSCGIPYRFICEKNPRTPL